MLKKKRRASELKDEGLQNQTFWSFLNGLLENTSIVRFPDSCLPDPCPGNSYSPPILQIHFLIFAAEVNDYHWRVLLYFTALYFFPPEPTPSSRSSPPLCPPNWELVKRLLQV